MLGIPEGEWTYFPYGKYGWAESVRWGHIGVYYGGRQAGVHLEISGQGCREYEAIGGDWIAFLGRWREAGGTLTRLDLAIDDFVGEDWTLSKLIGYARRGQLRSPFEWGKRIEKIRLKDGRVEGRSWYVGSGTSRIQVRFYEKDWERRGKGYEIEPGVKAWNRAEVQMRDERAEEAADLLIRTGEAGRIAAGILRRYVQYVRRVPDTNRARWPLMAWWERWLGYVEPLRLARAAPDRTVQKTYDWMRRQVACAMAVLDRVEPGREWVDELVREGDGRWREIHEWMVQSSGDDWARERYLNRLATVLGQRKSAFGNAPGKVEDTESIAEAEDVVHWGHGTAAEG